MAPDWTLNSTFAQDCLDIVLPYEEAILESITGVARPWNDLHHCSSLIPHLQEVKSIFSNPSTSDVHAVLNPLAPEQFSVEGNMFVISQVVPLNISRDPDKLVEPRNGLYLKNYFA